METLPFEAAVVAERVRRAISELVSPALPAGAVTVSIGVAPLTGNILDVDAWSKVVGQILYAAKQMGRNCCQASSDRSLAP